MTSQPHNDYFENVNEARGSFLALAQALDLGLASRAIDSDLPWCVLATESELSPREELLS